MGKSLTLDVRASRKKSDGPRISSRCCRPNMVICAGYGKENFPFPEVTNVVASCLKRLKAGSEHTEAEDGSGAKKFSRLRVRSRGLSKHESDNSGFDTGPTKLIAQLPPKKEALVDGTLFSAAEGLRLMMDDGKYDAIVAERFDDHSDKVQWARKELAVLHPKYLPAIESLEQHLAQLRVLYVESLPRVLSVLSAQNPDVDEPTLLDAAIDSLDEELSQILNVLRIWTDAFGQLRSGNYKQLEAVVFAVEQAFRLYEGEEPIGPCGEPGLARLKTSMFKVGNVFVARFSDQGPATLPGGRGPIGAHALEVPHDEQHIIALMLVLYMHEFRHDFFHDVEGLEDELTMKVAEAIDEACQSGEVKLSRKYVNVGRKKVPLKDLLIKVAADTIGEVDADICGGVLLSGPAYAINMISSFSAFNSKGESVFNTNRLLRTGSYFGMPDVSPTEKTIEFWPHPPDYIRAYIVAAALDEIGFPEDARFCRALADQAVGTPIPEHVVWNSEDPSIKTRIRIPFADFVAVAPVIARTLVRAQLETLDGHATGEVINWSNHRQKKVDILVETLLAGKSDVPKDQGDFYATYVAAAATIAYWKLVQQGVTPRRAAKLVNEKALDMITTLKAQFDSYIEGDGDSSKLSGHPAEAPCDRDESDAE